jgi:hypothetical protein
MSVYRSLGAPITDEVREEVGSVSVADIEWAMSKVGCVSTDVQRRVINKLWNKKKSDEATEIRAHQLVDNGFLKYSQVTIPSVDASGRIIEAFRADNTLDIVVKIRPRNMDAVFVVDANAVVRIWRTERPKIVNFYSSSAETTQSPFARVLDSIVQDYDSSVRTAWRQSRDDNAGFSHFITAWVIFINKTAYIGRRVSIKNKVTGILTDVRKDSEGKVLFVIDGRIYKTNRGATINIAHKEG